MRTLRWRGDDGSLPLAMLVVIVGVGLGMLTMTTMVRGASDTNGSIGRSSALLAARTGLASGLASLRAAGSTGNLGSISALPCSTGAPQVTGTISTKDGSYAATIWYLKSDPTQQTDAWVRANGFTCPTLLGQTPRWAYVSAVGSSKGARYNRTLIGTYQFKLQAMGNMPGGQIQVYHVPSAIYDYCLTAVSPTPTGTVSTAGIGTRLTMTQCITDPTDPASLQQKFGYMSNLTIKLMSADPNLYPNGLCVQAGLTEAAGQQLTLQDCGVTTNISQQWAFDSSSNFRGTSNGNTANSFCWYITSSSSSTYPPTYEANYQKIVLSTTCGVTTTYYESWNVTAAAGSGAAGPASGQLVNYHDFGKCLDFNYSGVNDWTFPCKQSFNLQAPDVNNVWNEVFTVPAAGTTGLVYTTRPDGVTKNCMKAPAAGQTLVTMATCPASASAAAASFIWLSRGDKAPTYDMKYRIEGTGSWAGQCLAPLTSQPAVQGNWVGLATCSGDTYQKWNADPPVSTSGLSSVIER